MTEIHVPKLNNNDESYVLVEWHVADDSPVGVDEVVATLETSKATEELVCATPGVLRHAVPAGVECRPGQVIARVIQPNTPWAVSEPGQRAATHAALPVITEPARAFIEEHGIDPDRVRALGLKLVRRSDVERLLGPDGAATPPATPTAPATPDPVGADAVATAGPAATADPDAPIHVLPPGQRAVARTVTRSHQTIPAAYTVVRVDVGAAEDEARRLGMRLRKPVGLPELLIAVLAPLHTSFPLCFGTPVDERSVRLADDAHIGLTIDAGRGLFVPVVRDASRLGIEEIVEIIGRFRLAGMRGAFREQELAGGNITISLNHDPEVVVAVPIIFPGQTCTLTLTGSRPELALDEDGALVTRTTTNLGLAYDHRFVNGREATGFLRQIKESLESR